jgi:hypothetical protein
MVVLVFLAACGRRIEFAAGERPTMPRDKLPKVVQPLLPARGIYAAGGGTTSAPWRVTLTLDGDLAAGAATSGDSFADMKTSKKKLDEATLREAVALADRAWREPRPAPTHPTADYDEIIIFVDGKDAWLIEGYGPLAGGAAEALMTRLRQLSGS